MLENDSRIVFDQNVIRDASVFRFDTGVQKTDMPGQMAQLRQDQIQLCQVQFIKVAFIQ